MSPVLVAAVEVAIYFAAFWSTKEIPSSARSGDCASGRSSRFRSSRLSCSPTRERRRRQANSRSTSGSRQSPSTGSRRSVRARRLRSTAERDPQGQDLGADRVGPKLASIAICSRRAQEREAGEPAAAGIELRDFLERQIQIAKSFRSSSDP
jgi:hypothetical protein